MSPRTVSVEELLMAAFSMVAKRRLMGTGISTWPIDSSHHRSSSIGRHYATDRNIGR